MLREPVQGSEVSNFPLSYKLSWPPRLLMPSLAGDDGAFAPAVARRGQPQKAVRLVFLGDISAVASEEPPEVDPALREMIAAADLVVANCESPVVERAGFPLATRFGLRHAMTPAFLGGGLAAAGATPDRLVLSLANNHALDQGIQGFDETVSALKALGIRTIGTAAEGLVGRVEAGGLTIGLLAFTLWRNASAGEFAGRVTMGDGIDGWTAQAEGLDLVCALPHWDFEFRHFPAPSSRALAERLAKQGSRLIVGGHAHVVQPVEWIGETLVAYGLGDLFGTVMPNPRWPLRIGALLSVEVSADVASRGEIAGYRVAPFLRERQGGRERLTPLAAARDPGAAKARQRIATIFAGRNGGQARQKSL